MGTAAFNFQTGRNKNTYLAWHDADKLATPKIASIRSGGFTLVELVITMVVIAILSAAAAIWLTARTAHSATVQADQFRRNLSHIQLLAISTGARLRLTVASDSYTVTSCPTPSCSPTNPVTDPASGQNFSVSLTDGVTLSGTTLDFDSLGRPQLNGNWITSNTTYTLSGSGTCVDISVRPLTGFASAALPRAC